MPSFSLQALLLDKALEPLGDQNNRELERLQKLDVSSFNETDVRAEIIDNIVRILGYRKGEYSSVDREKHISFADKKSKYIDYNLTLWEKNFWLIEAKRPDIKKDRFGYDELSQAVEYAIHPEINAALVVLCDGVKLEIFDREEDVVNPILRINIKEIAREFDKVRKLLSPLNVWFFYKRRVIRAIDRAFEHEINQERVAEFGNIVMTCLNHKRSQILKNLQSLKLSNVDKYTEQLSAASLDEIVDIHFFMDHSHAQLTRIVDNLMGKCQARSTFSVLYKMFPDKPRDVNDFYYIHGLLTLIELKKCNLETHWLPAWLGGMSNNGDITPAIQRLLNLCLNYFASDEARKTVLLSSNTFRRLFKLLAVLLPQIKSIGEINHVLTRFHASEFSWEQILSSPERHSLLLWEQLTMTTVYEFMRRHSREDKEFNIELAKQELRDLWSFEKRLLSSVKNYRTLLKEHNFGELHPTEASGVVYDNLGDLCLCVLMERSPEWIDFVTSQHVNEIQALARMNSWAAKGILQSKSIPITTEPIKDEELSDRFFFGDIETLRTLRNGYKLI